MTARVMSAVLGTAIGLVLGVAGADEVQDRLALGQREYQDHCIQCHGTSGRGEGPRAESLPRMPPDLTTTAHRNGGIFPAAYARAAIDGRAFYNAPRPMPAWGQYYSIESYSMADSAMADRYVDARLAALVAYVATLQAQ